MQTSRWTLRARAAMLAGAALAVTVAATAARAEDNLPDAKLFREILKGVGVIPNDNAGIDYRERSPLVLPQSDALPPPEAKSAADQAPNWPVDDDVRRTREAAIAASKGGHTLEDEDHVLTPAEMTPGRRSRPGAVYGSTTTIESSGNASAMMPSALGYVGGLFTNAFGPDKDESKPFKSEPPRTALVEPPPGYQTPASSQPYGIGKPKDDGKFHDPMNYYWEKTDAPSN